MIIAIDFDGTIVENDFPKIGKLRPNAKRIINFWRDALKAKVIIWTVRTTAEDVKAATDFLDAQGIGYDAVNKNHFVPFLNHPKIYADIYIDDRQAGGIPEDFMKIWDLIRPQVERIMKHKAGNPAASYGH